ncbi:MAG: hypothetical protein J0I43_04680 [Microbacterium sp.]|nr:hypothetical protein [Microbacterium sp.]
MRRRPSAAVYRRRRLVAVLIVLAIVIAVVLAIWQPWKGAAGGTGATPAPTGTTASISPTPSATTPAGEATTAPAADPAPSASGTDPAIPACTTSDISVLAVTDKDSYGAGEQPQLSISLSNTSSTPCLINVGTATQAFVITSGTDTWWRSTDCQSESSDQVVQLAAGQTVGSVTPLVWDRTRSSVDTCDSTSRPSAAAGYYHLQVSIGGIVGADTKMFELQ